LVVLKLVEIENLKKFFPLSRGLFRKGKEGRFVHAVNGVNFYIKDREILGLVGESGCGKTTLGKIVLKFLEPTYGTVRFNGQDIFKFNKEELKEYRLKAQMIFQNVLSSLNPRKKVRQIIDQGLSMLGSTDSRGSGREKRVLDLLETVGLSGRAVIDKYPYELSGGERQRVSIARAISVNPRFIVADEPVSSLDMSIRAQTLNVIKELRGEKGVSFLYITHDLSVVRSLCDVVVVMYLGKVMEQVTVNELFNNPLHPYTKSLLSATPIPNPKVSRKIKRIILKGEVPSPIDIPQGCPFRPRCPESQPQCIEEPPLIQSDNHSVACWLPKEKR
jgi:oligopeptide/dipeptide ABC transporter ATP-binding protein